MRTKFGRTVIVALAVGAAAVQAAGPAVVKSAALTAETRVDGLITDWTTLSSLTKEVSVAAANDQDRLVIAIATSDASVKQRLLAAGVIVYLDPKGKKAKTFGVRIPPPRNPEGRQPAVTYVEVLGPAAKESHIVDLAARTGFEVGRDENQGTLLIEVAVPLRPSNGTAIAAPVDPALKAIGLGLVTPDVPVQGRGQPGEGGRGGGASGGRGGMGGGMGRGGGGFGGPPGGAQGPGRSQGKELKVWTSLELAPRSAPTTPGVPLP